MPRNRIEPTSGRQRRGSWSLALPLLLLSALLMSACDTSGGTGSQPGQSAVAQPAPNQPSANNPQPVYTAVRPGGQPTIPPLPTIPPIPALPNGDGKTLLADDFTHTNIASYSIVDINPDPDMPPSSWSVHDGAITQDGDAYGNPVARDTLALTGDASWTDYRVDALAYAAANPVGLVARYTKAGFYRLRANRNSVSGDGWLLQRYDADKQAYTTLAQGPASNGYTKLNWNLLTLTVKGQQITASVNGQQVASVVDNTYTQGRVGFYTEAIGGSRFTSLRVLTSN